MYQRSCDLCDNASVIHDTVIRGGIVKVRHLCRTHGLKTWRDSLPVENASPGSSKKDPVFQALVADASKVFKQRGDTGPAQP
jgi:hypothetical protein